MLTAARWLASLILWAVTASKLFGIFINTMIFQKLVFYISAQKLQLLKLPTEPTRPVETGQKKQSHFPHEQLWTFLIHHLACSPALGIYQPITITFLWLMVEIQSVNNIAVLVVMWKAKPEERACIKRLWKCPGWNSQGRTWVRNCLQVVLGFWEWNCSLNLIPVTPTPAPRGHCGCLGATERKAGAFPFHGEVCKLQVSGPLGWINSSCTDISLHFPANPYLQHTWFHA